jgi:hypothetical protein
MNEPALVEGTDIQSQGKALFCKSTTTMSNLVYDGFQYSLNKMSSAFAKVETAPRQLI